MAIAAVGIPAPVRLTTAVPMRMRLGPERPVHRPPQLVREQQMRQLVVHEVDVAQREPDAVQGVVGEAPRLGERRTRGGQRVPGAGRGIGLPVLDGVQQMREPPEQPAHLGERLGIPRPPGENRRVREGGGGRRLGRLGHGQDGAAGPDERLDPGLPLDGVEQHRGVEPDVRSGTRTGPSPARGDLPRGGGHRPAREKTVPVVDVVAHLRRREDQGDGGGEPRTLALRDGRAAHTPQRTGPGLPPPATGRTDPLALSLRQNGDEQTVIVGDDAGELPVVAAQCQTEPAEMGHPLGFEALTEPMRAGPNHAEQEDSPYAG